MSFLVLSAEIKVKEGNRGGASVTVTVSLGSVAGLKNAVPEKCKAFWQFSGTTMGQTVVTATTVSHQRHPSRPSRLLRVSAAVGSLAKTMA